MVAELSGDNHPLQGRPRSQWGGWESELEAYDEPAKGLEFHSTGVKTYLFKVGRVSDGSLLDVKIKAKGRSVNISPSSHSYIGHLFFRHQTIGRSRKVDHGQ